MTISKNFIRPDGSKTPEVYIVGEAGGFEEDRQGKPFVGRSGQLLRSTLEDIGVGEEEWRMFNVVPYRPYDEENQNRTPTDEEIEKYKKYLHADIKKTNPKRIICLGRIALKAFSDFEGSMTAAIQKGQFEWEGYEVYCTWHPSYVLRRGGEGTPAHTQFDLHLRRFTGREEKKENLNFEYETFELDQVDEFLSKFEDAEIIGYDVEGSSLDAYTEHYVLGGFSFARDGYSAYLRFTDFWNDEYTITEEVRKSIAEFFERNQHKIVVFNAQYEIPVTHNVFEFEPTKFQDTMQHGRCINITGGLKNISNTYLSSGAWADENDYWVENITQALVCLKPTKKRDGTFNPRREQILLEENSVQTVIDQLQLGKKEKNKETGRIDQVEWAENSREYKLLRSLRFAIERLERSHESEEANSVLKAYLLKKLMIRDYECRYSEIPIEIVSKYCCSDSHNTLQLYKLLRSKLIEENQTKTASYYDEHIGLAYELEMNGVFWDDEVATKTHAQYEEDQISALREFILLPHVRKSLLVSLDGKEEPRPLNSQDILNIQSKNDIDYLKKIFNPMSTDKKARSRYSNLLRTPELVVALLLNEVESFVSSDEKNASSNYPVLSKICKAIHLSPRKEKLPKIKKFISSIPVLRRNNKLTYEEFDLIKKYDKWTLPDTQLDTIKNIYYSVTGFLGVDVDDRSTWGREMQTLFYYRLFKKIDKAKGTYINGGPGRGSVHIVPANDFSRLVRHSANYGERLPSKEKEAYILRGSFGANTAMTRRWTAGMHTIPAGSELRSFWISRFVDGVFIHFDYSQMEVRVLAFLAQEQSLLQAYIEGKDVHRFVASKVWQKEESEVSSEERRFAKLCTFSLLYGKSEYTFAAEFMNGNLAEAEKLYSMFFTMFPGIKKWVAEQHRFFMENGYVETLWGEKLYIQVRGDSKGAINAAKREAQNWPIQGTASQVAGLALARTASWIRDNGYMSKMFCFTHDSSDMDTPIEETLELCTVIPEIAEEEPRKEFGIPVAIDIEMGVNGSEMIEFKGIDGNRLVTKTNTGYKIHGKFEGKKSSIDLLLPRLQKSCPNVEFQVEKEKESYRSWSEMFELKGAYTQDFGNTTIKQEGIIVGET